MASSPACSARASLDAVVRAAWTARGCPLPGWDDLLGPAAAPDDADFAQVTALLARGALGRELLGARAAASVGGGRQRGRSPRRRAVAHAQPRDPGHAPGDRGGARVARPRA